MREASQELQCPAPPWLEAFEGYAGSAHYQPDDSRYRATPRPGRAHVRAQRREMSQAVTSFTTVLALPPAPLAALAD